MAGLRRRGTAARPPSRAADAAGRPGDHGRATCPGWRLVRLLPERRAQALFRRVADEIYRRDGAGVQRLRANLPGCGPSSTTTRSTR